MLMRLLTLLLSVFLVANVVGCCLRALGGKAPEPASSQSASESPSSESASAASSAPASGASAPESASAAQQTLPESLTLAEALAFGDSDTAEIYASESQKRLSVSTSYAGENIGRLGIDALKKVEVASPVTPEDTAYVSVTCGDMVFYVFKGTDYGRLDAAEQTAYYSLPSGLYSKIQLAMMFM